MKMIILASTLLLSLNALAETTGKTLQLEKILSKQCDGNPVAVAEGESVYLNPDRGLFGIASKDDKACTNLDISQTMIISSGSVLTDGKTSYTTVLQNISAIGRKSSCAEGLQPSSGIKFDQAQIVKSDNAYTVTLTNANECKNLVLSVEKNYR